MDPARRDELVGFIRDNTSTVPWPQVQEVLQERGFTKEEIAAALDEVFPGQDRKPKSSGLWAGMVGAVVGMVVWLLLALLYHSSR